MADPKLDTTDTQGAKNVIQQQKDATVSTATAPADNKGTGAPILTPEERAAGYMGTPGQYAGFQSGAAPVVPGQNPVTGAPTSPGPNPVEAPVKSNDWKRWEFRNVSNFQQGFDQAKADGVGSYTRDAQGNVFDSKGTQMTLDQGKPNSLPLGPDGKPITNLETLPMTAADGRDTVNKYVPQNNDQNAKTDTLLQEDPQLKQLQQERQNIVNSTQTSFTADYQAMVKSSGMDAIDTRLIDINKIINGTQDSIRHEITAAGGFATERQVLALTNAANKSLISEYKTLVQQKAATEKHISTVMGFEEKDRAAADKRYSEISGIDKQIATREQQIQNNNVKTFDFLQKTVGYKGLLDATGGDPYYKSLIEKTLGLPQGGLDKAAQDEIKKAPSPIKTGAPGTGSTSNPKLFAFNSKQLTTLNSRGLTTRDAQGILKDIQAGHSFEDIRTNMKKGGVNPQLLDDVMQIVDPKNNKPPTTSKKGGVTI